MKGIYLKFKGNPLSYKPEESSLFIECSEMEEAKNKLKKYFDKIAEKNSDYLDHFNWLNVDSDFSYYDYDAWASVIFKNHNIPDYSFSMEYQFDFEIVYTKI